MKGVTVMTYSGKKYIYSVDHANKLIEMGFICIGTGFNVKSHKYYWVFNWTEIQPYYENNERYH